MNGNFDRGDSRRQSNTNSNTRSGGRYALIICLVISAFAVAAMGLFVPSNEAKNPIEAFMLFARDGFKLNSGDEDGWDDEDDDRDDGDSWDDGESSDHDDITDSDLGNVSDANSDTDSNTDSNSGSDSGSSSGAVTDSSGTDGSSAPDNEPPHTTVPDTPSEPIDPVEYYKDVLFIGDSRTAGMYIYGRIDGASYFARTSMTVNNCFNSTKSETGTGSLSLEAYLKKNQFGKIYILLGINEIGYSYNWIVTRYQKLITRIQELQPNAVIVIQSNMHVTKAKSDANPNTFNNARIDELNRRLSQLADGKRVFYLSFESIFDGADGCMNSDYSGDGVHLKAKSYKIWKNYLLSDGMIRLPSDDSISVVTKPDNSVGKDDQEITTDPPTTNLPTTNPPTTNPPTTEPPTTEPPTTEPPTTEPSTTEPPDTVSDNDASYFSDALFIGDSRTVGLYLYGGFGEATFFAKNSATVYTFLNGYETATPDARMGDKTLSEVLSEKKFGKIYILFGINELGGSAPSAIKGGFERFIALLKAAQPGAKLIIQSNMHVTKEYEDSYPSRGKSYVNELNSLLAGLANGKDVFYLGFETLFDNDEGYLRDDYTRDGLHFLAGTPYKAWADYLREFGTV